MTFLKCILFTLPEFKSKLPPEKHTKVNIYDCRLIGQLNVGKNINFSGWIFHISLVCLKSMNKIENMKRSVKASIVLP